jgi:hypothetical protein
MRERAASGTDGMRKDCKERQGGRWRGKRVGEGKGGLRVKKKKEG